MSDVPRIVIRESTRRSIHNLMPGEFFRFVEMKQTVFKYLEKVSINDGDRRYYRSRYVHLEGGTIQKMDDHEDDATVESLRLTSAEFEVAEDQP